MAEPPQPGLLPIIPPRRPQPGPSPLIPIIVLFIMGTLRWTLQKLLEIWGSFEIDPYELGAVIESIQSQLTITALLIPLCLVLLIQAFGMPYANHAYVRNAPRLYPVVEAIAQNFWGSVVLVIVILALLFSVSIRRVLHSSWSPENSRPVTAYAVPALPVGGGGGRSSGGDLFNSAVCQELGILKRRCENWKGNSRNAVCRELAVLQKKCERSLF